METHRLVMLLKRKSKIDRILNPLKDFKFIKFEVITVEPLTLSSYNFAHNGLVRCLVFWVIFITKNLFFTRKSRQYRKEIRFFKVQRFHKILVIFFHLRTFDAPFLTPLPSIYPYLSLSFFLLVAVEINLNKLFLVCFNTCFSVLFFLSRL